MQGIGLRCGAPVAESGAFEYGLEIWIIILQKDSK